MEARLAKLGDLMIEKNTKKDLIGADTQVKFVGNAFHAFNIDVSIRVNSCVLDDLFYQHSGFSM
jgi:hypothetical protein